MHELEQRIRGDWAEIKQKAINLNSLVEYFKPNPDEIQTQKHRLTLAVEQGIIEYKRTVLLPLFAILNDLQFKAVGFAEIEDKKRDMDFLVFMTLVQRLFCSGILKLSGAGSQKMAEKQDSDLKVIIADILSQIKQEPGLKKNPQVKMILTQVAIYKKERETMQKLSPNIKDKSKAESFYQNFRETFRRIFQNIQKNYREFVAEQAKKRAQQEKRYLLLHVPLKDLVPFFYKQARLFARIMSTLGFAIKERYKTREILVTILQHRDQILSLLEMELFNYRELTKLSNSLNIERDSIKISMELCREVETQLDNLLENQE